MDTSAITAVRYFRRDKENAVRMAAWFRETADLSQEQDRQHMEALMQWVQYTSWCYGRVLLTAYRCLSVYPRDSVEYRVLYHRYILGRKWRRLGDEMYYSTRHVKRIGRSALERLQGM